MSEQAEKMTIGCILIDNSSIGNCSFLTPEMFINPTYRYLFQRSTELLVEDREVNSQSLTTVCSDRYSENDMNNILTDCCIDADSWKIKDYALSIVRDYQIKGQRDISEKIKKVKISPANIVPIIKDLKKSLDALDIETDVEDVMSSALADRCKKNRFKKRENKFLFFGMSNLDENIGGLEGGDVAVIAARPGVGKSAFANELIIGFCKKGLKVGLFNVELTTDQVYDRFICRLSGIELRRIRNATAFNQSTNEEEVFEKANDEFSSYNLHIFSGKSSIDEIRGICAKSKFDVVVIDYLQLVTAKTSYSNRREEVGVISKSIKKIAMKNKIPVIVLSQLNRNNGDDREPNVTDLRESGDIEQDASVIMLLWNKSQDKTEKCIKVAKSRQGKQGTGYLKFEGSKMKFTEINKIKEKFNIANEDGFMQLDDSPFAL